MLTAINKTRIITGFQFELNVKKPNIISLFYIPLIIIPVENIAPIII